MINDCQKRTYEAGREATESLPRANRDSLVQLRAHVIHNSTTFCVTSYFGYSLKNRLFAQTSSIAGDLYFLQQVVIARNTTLGCNWVVATLQNLIWIKLIFNNWQ